MDSPIPALSMIDDLPEARLVKRRPSRALEEDPDFYPGRIALVVTAIGALLASALVAVLLY